MIITIDGPAGSGKSSVSKALAQKLKYIHLNSGLLYRSVYYICQEKGVSLQDEASIQQILKGFTFDFQLNMVDFHTEIRVFFRPDEKTLDVKTLLSDQCAQGASLVGVLPYVRDYLTDFQRRMGDDKNLVLEGRDAGSIVFPDADYKFYIDASLEERVKRRFIQEASEGVSNPDLENQIFSEMQKRDERDRTRAIAPQVIPDQALVLDTTHLSLEEVVEELYRHLLHEEQTRL